MREKLSSVVEACLVLRETSQVCFGIIDSTKNRVCARANLNLLPSVSLSLRVHSQVRQPCLECVNNSLEIFG